MTDRKVPPPCDNDIFQHGKPFLAADTYDCGADGFETWTKNIAAISGQKVDWHYSGGIAQMLYIGDRDKIAKAIENIPCPARIMKVFDYWQNGLFRKGVTPSPSNAIAGFSDGQGTTFIVKDDEKDHGIGQGTRIQPHEG